MTTPHYSVQPLTTNLAKEVLNSLKADTQDLQSLSQLLLTERHALEENDHRRIIQIAEEKGYLVENMGRRHSLRTTQLNKQQINDHNDWKATLQRLESHSQLPLLAMWQEMEKILQHCREELIINQRIVDSMQRRTTHFINLLKGKTGFGQTYNARGETENISSQNAISHA